MASKVREEKLKRGGKPPDVQDAAESPLANKRKPSTGPIIKAGDPNSKKGSPSPAIASATGRKKKDDDGKSKGGGKPGKKGKPGEPAVKKIKKVRVKRTPWDKLMASLGLSVQNAVLRDPRAIESANALGLRPHHIRKLKAKFDTIDIDGSGAIDYDEFFEAIGEQRSPFTDRLFNLIDLDGSGTIEFDEFVRVLATYCMYSKDEILRFCFECFDVDGSGTIDEKEFIELCK